MRILFFLLLVFSPLAQAELKELGVLDFQSQHEETVTLNEKTQWVLFVVDMEGANFVKAALEKLKISNPADLGGLYVSDISKMPSLVTSMFALPKMKKYPFKMALDHSGDSTSTWPRSEKKVTLLRLSSLKVEKVETLDGAEAVEKFLLSLKK